MIASVVVVLVPALLGALLAKVLFDRSGPSGPKPYDMREEHGLLNVLGRVFNPSATRFAGR